MKKPTNQVPMPPDYTLLLEAPSGNYEGRWCVLRTSWFKPELQSQRFTKPLMFKACGGFGCDPEKMGRAVVGFFGDGEHLRVNREDIEFFVKKDSTLENELNSMFE
jgi:hypothetical protein